MAVVVPVHCYTDVTLQYSWLYCETNRDVGQCVVTGNRDNTEGLSIVGLAMAAVGR
jgi:hypothetical protein